jgi:hypothetical protein
MKDRPSKPPKQVLSDKDKENFQKDIEYILKNWKWINEKFNKNKPEVDNEKQWDST